MKGFIQYEDVLVAFFHTGRHTNENGRSASRDAEDTPVQFKSNDLEQAIARPSFAAGLILFTPLMIMFFF